MKRKMDKFSLLLIACMQLVFIFINSIAKLQPSRQPICPSVNTCKRDFIFLHFEYILFWKNFLSIVISSVVLWQCRYFNFWDYFELIEKLLSTDNIFDNITPQSFKTHDPFSTWANRLSLQQTPGLSQNSL